MDHITLNNDVRMPILGFGVFQIPESETEAAVTAALEAGYRAIDTAAAYQNEAAVGRAIAASGIAREDLFITTKLWVSDAGEGRARAAFERSLTNLGLDHLDLYLIHQPFGDYYGSWRDMQRINAEGLSRAIGVSNFHGDRLADLIAHHDIVPAVNQIETHPFHARTRDQAFMASRGVAIESWGPYAEGKNGIFTHPVLTAIGEEHGKSAAQVVLRWLIQRGVITVCKSVHPERMAENLEVFDFALTEDQMASVSALDTGASLFIDHRSPETAEWFASWKLEA